MSQILESSFLGYLKITENAYPPELGSPNAAGYDLSSAHQYIVPPHAKALVKTDLSIKLPEGTYGRIAPRSGLACRYSIDVLAGVIDPDYTGNVGVLLFNYCNKEFRISRGDRIAQLICEKFEKPKLIAFKKEIKTKRGHKGLGSTGVKRCKRSKSV